MKTTKKTTNSYYISLNLIVLKNNSLTKKSKLQKKINSD